MDDEMRKSIEDFRNKFANGLLELEKAKTSDPGGQGGLYPQLITLHRRKASHRAMESLLTNTYFHQLWNDTLLQQVYDQLEETLAIIGNKLDTPENKKNDDVQQAVHCSKESFKEERNLLFWGGLCKIYIHYTDEAHYFTATTEKRMRADISEASTKLITLIQNLSDHPVGQVVYSKARRVRLVDAISYLQNFESTMMENSADSMATDASIIVDDFDTLRIQFIKSVSWLCLKLFGNINSVQIATFLMHRSEVDKENGLLPWPGYVMGEKKSRAKVKYPKKLKMIPTFDAKDVPTGQYDRKDGERVIRKYLKPAVAHARHIADEENWATREIIKHFENRGRK